MMIPIQGLGELVLEVRDLERAKAFYAEVLGLPITHWDPRVAVIDAPTFRLQLRLWGTPGHRGAGPCHFAFRVGPEQIEPIAAFLQERALLARGPVDFGAGGRSVFCFDPDGNEVEFSDAWSRSAA
jgi:catechol 2,3-dioxygenase-like lactoylglutathione lyase family enzyme